MEVDRERVGALDETAEPAIAELPVAVRLAILDWASDTVGHLPPAQIPASLQRIARFAPMKRARVGGAALVQALENDAGFRAAVAERVRSSGAARIGPDGDLDGIRAGHQEAGQEPAGSAPGDRFSAVRDPALPGAGGPDPVQAAAVASLLRLPTAAALVAAVRSEQSEHRGDEAELRRAVRYLQGELGRTRAELALRSEVDPVADTAAAVDKLQRRLREQGTRLRKAEEAAGEADRRADEQLAGLRGAVARLTDEITGWQERARSAEERADRAQESLGRLREQAGRHRATADRRLELLLTTAEGAVNGLRREWNLAGGGADPADVVAARIPGPPPTGENAAEPSRLHGWLGLPAAHLIVDGYNVSKTGYPELTLAQQRDRLVRSLAALAARTSAEVTVVFDGAAVAVPAGPNRGVRVLFSPPGVIADDVIRDLAAAEPPGRVVVVVSSDREVADRVRRLGARTAGSPVLLGLLG